MAARIIDGRKIASEIRSEVREKVAGLKESGISPKLCVVLVGDDPASVIYARSKERACRKSGIDYELFTFPGDAQESEVIDNKKNCLQTLLPWHYG